jgi:hypothetical protein
MKEKTPTASTDPMIGASRYTHKCSVCIEINAGASERAGFIEAPEIGPANIASNPTTAPIEIPANAALCLVPFATHSMTSIKIQVRMISKTNDCTDP